VRATPLATGNASALAQMLRAVPEDMLVFSSGFGAGGEADDSAACYGPVFQQLGQRRKQLFMGGAAEALYARMGDPLRRPRVLKGCGGAA